MSVTPARDEDFDELRAAFLNRLPDRVDAIEEAWAKFARDREPAAFEPLKMLVHRLAGSAATYGLHDVCAKARELDRETHPVVAVAPFMERLLALREATERLRGEEKKGSVD